MHPYRKLQQLCIGLIMSPCAFAITLDPIHIETTQGNLLYAEIPFRNASPNNLLHVELASVEDLRAIGARHQPPRALNFFTRKNAKGEGVIVITSSQPLYEKELDIVIKIKSGQQTRLQHIQRPLNAAESTKKTTPNLNEQPLKPTYVLSEQEIALNLPVSTQMRQPPAMQSAKPLSPLNIPHLAEEKVLRTQAATPPPMQVIQAAPLAPKQLTATAETPRQTRVQTAATAHAVPAPDLAAQPSAAAPSAVTSIAVDTVQPQTALKTITQPPKPKVETTSVAAVAPATPAQDTSVQAPPPLIVQEPTPAAEQVLETPQPTPQAATDAQLPIKASAEEQAATDAQPPITPPAEEQAAIQNKTATPAPSTVAAQPTASPLAKHVVKANESLWRIARQIAHQSDQSIHDVMQHIQQQNSHAFVNGDINRLKRGVVLNLSGSEIPAQVEAQKAKQAANGRAAQAKTKYKLHDAQMRLVGEHDRGQATGTDKKTQSSANTSTELATKVMTSREKSVKLQKVVQALDIQLQQKDHKIKLLNAKLAQLEAQLKRQQQNAKKP